jgi:hypothetical protein
MPAVNPSPLGLKPQFELANGLPAVGNQLFFYVGGSVNSKQTTFADSTGTVPNPNPIVLNALGQTPNELWLSATQTYKIVYTVAGDTDPPSSPIFTVDNVPGAPSSNAVASEWVDSGLTPTFASATSFSVPGDQTSIFQVGRRVKTTNAGGTVYSTITNSVFGLVTTVTVVNDSGVLDVGLSAVAYSFISAVNSSLPQFQYVFVDAEVPAGVIDGINAVFTLANVPNPAASLRVTHKDGPEFTAFGVDFVLVGKVFTFNAPAIPQGGDSLRCWYRIQ